MTISADQPVALVTGGSKGIGRAVCVELAKAGYHLAINYLKVERTSASAIGTNCLDVFIFHHDLPNTPNPILLVHRLKSAK